MNPAHSNHLAARLSTLLALGFLLVAPQTATPYQILTEFKPAYDPVSVTWDGTSLWVLESGIRIHRLDPASLEELWSFEPDTREFLSEVIASDGRRIWGASWPGLEIAEIDPADGRVLRKSRLRSADGAIEGAPFGLVWKDGELWMLMTGPAFLDRVDPASGEILRKIRLPFNDARGLAWDGAAFWVRDPSGQLVRIDPHSAQILATLPAFGRGASSLAWDGHALWVAAGSLDKIDVNAEPYETMRELRALPWGLFTRYFDLERVDSLLWLSGTGIDCVNPDAPGEFHQGVGLPAGAGASGIAFDGTHLWSAYRYFGGALYEIDPAFGQVLGSHSYGGREPMGMAFDGKRLWIADDADSSLRVYSWPDAAFQRRVPAPGPEPTGVAWDGFALWESDRSTGLLSRLEAPTAEVTAQYRLPFGFPHGIDVDRRTGSLWALDDAGARTVELAFPPGPTHLFDWRSEVVDSSVILSWKLTLGSAPTSLSVERASSPTGFYVPIGSAQCAGDGCRFVDNSPIAGSPSYYRIRVGEADGASKIVGPLSVAFRFSYSPLQGFGTPGQLRGLASPNPAPASGTSIWAVGGPGGAVHALITDVRGRLVGEVALPERSPGVFGGTWNATSPDGRRVGTGVYFARIEDGNGARTSLRIVILR